MGGMNIIKVPPCGMGGFMKEAVGNSEVSGCDNAQKFPSLHVTVVEAMRPQSSLVHLRPDANIGVDIMAAD